MMYPDIPSNLKQAPYQELARVEMDLRMYKNVTILTIPHWRAIPQLKDAIKEVNRDQRRVLKEIKARPEFTIRIAPPTQSQTSQPEKIQVNDRVRSKFHNAEGEIIRIEWSARVGNIYHVKLDSGETVYVAREDLSRVEK